MKYRVTLKRRAPLTLGGVVILPGEQFVDEGDFQAAAAVHVDTEQGPRCYLKGLCDDGVVEISETPEASTKAETQSAGKARKGRTKEAQTLADKDALKAQAQAKARAANAAVEAEALNEARALNLAAQEAAKP